MKTSLKQISLKNFLSILAPIAGLGSIWYICAGKWYMMSGDLQGNFESQYLYSLLSVVTSLKEQLLNLQNQTLVGALLEDSSYLALLSRGEWILKAFYGFLSLVVLLEGIYLFCYILCRVQVPNFSYRKLGVFNGVLVLGGGVCFLLFANYAFTTLDDAFSSFNAIADWLGAGINAKDIIRLTTTPAVICVLGVVQGICSLLDTETHQPKAETSSEKVSHTSLL